MIGRLQRALMVFQLLGAAAIAGWLVADLRWHWVAAVVAGLLVPVLIHAVLLLGGFGLAARDPDNPAGTGNGPDHPETARQHKGAARGVARLAALAAAYPAELLASMRTIYWLHPFREHARLAQPQSARAVPVLLLHGYCCNRGMWLPLARLLSKAGHPLAAITLEPVLGSIDDYVEAIDRMVETLAREHQCDQIALVCHSMGGLAARAYLRKRGGARVARVITIGTPHRGTTHARFAPGRNAWQMRRGNSWLAALAAGESEDTYRRFTLISSSEDNIVAPANDQRLVHAEVVELRGIGHLAMAMSGAVHRMVLARLIDVR